MAETNAAATAAATKIQAIARGNRGRKKFKDYVIKMIEEMMAAQDPKHAVAAQPKPPPEKPRSGRVFRLSRISADEDDYVEDTDNEMDVDVDEGFTEEEIITVVIDDDQYTDHTREELVAEFVTYGDLSPPPPPKTGFELYNAQLKVFEAGSYERTAHHIRCGGTETDFGSFGKAAHGIRSGETETDVGSIETTAHRIRCRATETEACSIETTAYRIRCGGKETEACPIETTAETKA
jgi:hypothetical protein